MCLLPHRLLSIATSSGSAHTAAPAAHSSTAYTNSLFELLHLLQPPPTQTVSFFAAAIVAEVNGSSWLADSSRHKRELLCFFETDSQHLTDNLSTYHLPFELLYFSTLCLWHACIHFHVNFHFIVLQFHQIVLFFNCSLFAI